jgi:hypothetical protein
MKKKRNKKKDKPAGCGVAPILEVTHKGRRDRATRDEGAR